MTGLSAIRARYDDGYSRFDDVPVRMRQDISDLLAFAEQQAAEIERQRRIIEHYLDPVQSITVRFVPACNSEDPS